MKFITIVAALFATAAFAAPVDFDDFEFDGDDHDVDQDDFQGRQPNWNNNNRNNGWNNGGRQPNWNNNNNGGRGGNWASGNGGNEEGPYQMTCTCVSGGREDQWAGQSACRNLNQQFPNLQWDGRGCVDLNNQGLEYNGFRRACQQAGGNNWNVDAQCF